jgi:hypothetical protein
LARINYWGKVPFRLVQRTFPPRDNYRHSREYRPGFRQWCRKKGKKKECERKSRRTLKRVIAVGKWRCRTTKQLLRVRCGHPQFSIASVASLTLPLKMPRQLPVTVTRITLHCFSVLPQIWIAVNARRRYCFKRCHSSYQSATPLQARTMHQTTSLPSAHADLDDTTCRVASNIFARTPPHTASVTLRHLILSLS